MRREETKARAIGPGGGVHNYSTEEQVIGTWQNADGTRQPLYEKTIRGTFPKRSWNNLFYDSNINIKNYFGNYFGTYNNNVYTIGLDFLGDSSVLDWHANTFLRNHKALLCYYRGNNTEDYINYNITIQYTKTTDTPT